MDEEIKTSLTAKESWIRGLYMLLFAVIYWVAETVLAAVAILQFIFLLVARSPNERLQEFGDDLSVYFYQIVQFLTFNTEEKPFPFKVWPYGADGSPDPDLKETEPVVEPASPEDAQVQQESPKRDEQGE